MRRFADPKLGYDPEENLGRLARDLHRISTAATSRQGRLEAVFGHRALAVFEGDGAAFSALGALLSLSLPVMPAVSAKRIASSMLILQGLTSLLGTRRV